MRGIALWFLLLAILAALIGMVWGLQMAATNDHTLSPAHGHLNLVGWVTLSIFALYYHTVPAAALSRLAKVHFVLAAAGVVIMVPGIALVRLDGTEGAAVLGSLLTLLSMLTFAAVVLRSRDG
jgi:hypothetical protein